MNGLNKEQIAFFRENGYLLLEKALDPADFQPLIAELEAVVDRRAREAQTAGRLTNIFEG